MAQLISLQSLQRWGIKGGISVLDQGLFSGANFAASIIFARSLSAVDYGAYAVVFALYLLLTGFYTAFILEPMSVLGPAKYLMQLPSYLLIQVKLHAILTTIFLLVFVLVGSLLFSVGNASLGRAFMGMSTALPFMLMLWLVRRAFYVLNQPTHAFAASTLYLLALFLCIFVLYSIDLLNSFTCFVILGVASLLGSAFFFLRKIDQHPVDMNLELNWIHIAKEQWTYGRWIGVASILSFSANQIQTVLLAGLINLQAAGALDALQNFIAPMSQGSVAISTLVLPTISYDYGKSDITKVHRKVIAVLVVLTISAGIYEVLLLLFSSQLETLLYSGKYSDFSYLIPVLGIIPILNAVTTGYALALRAIQRPQFYLFYGLVIAPIGLVTAVWFSYVSGVEGAIMSLVMTSLAALVVHIYLYRRWFVS